MKREILIIGGSGQVGLELQRQGDGKLRITAPSRRELDLCDAVAVRQALAARPWSAIVNAAAYTDVDGAESEIVETWQVNALGPAVVAAETARQRVPLVHVSTDYVFDGKMPRPYQEDDPVRPLSVYGASKEAGEQAVRTANPRHVILRTAWVYSAHRKNFVLTMLKLAAARPELRVVDDQVGCPTSAADIASAIRAIVGQIVDAPEAAAYGTFHFAGGGETTWCGLAQLIFSEAGSRLSRTPMIIPITTAEYPTPAVRPANSRLDCARLCQVYRIAPRPWQDGVADVLRDVLT